MIEGVGVDIVAVERIRKIYEKFGAKFLNKVFTEGEISYSFSHSNPFPHLAARFAVKEAVIKALKKQRGLTLKNIEVRNNSDGSPYVTIPGFYKKIFISISHEKNYTVAFVIIT
ncbi:holo-ACP synthase [Thermodesulfovibrio yellowstonii]|uniref:Holo-[acyl-carrier-protein] synthase n=1 Tax=Thermodesulfovibrio yellowstonii TaxID=28262 RepID=A0A9W6LLQ9_9BACT|nr:holo-ACP synthase [Thermodesulfovibrio islandicus]GLI54095.1 holo-[acyl-carrier-protein] synthase [Thermodesulfovibrio islandicus]